MHPYVFVVLALSWTYAGRILQYFGATGVAVACDTRRSYVVAGCQGMTDKAKEYGVDIVVVGGFGEG